MGKPVLILVNPKSGRGKSVRVFERLVRPKLEACNLSYELHVTEPGAGAEQLLGESRLLSVQASYSSIVVVSGDGLLHEVVNALMARSDAELAMQTPLGIIPTGSGNGMAYTLLRQHQQQHQHQQQRRLTRNAELRLFCEQALQTAAACRSDLVRLSDARGARTWSFLSVGWGLMADIDVDSDWLRWLGELRFTLYGLLRCFTARAYRGRLAYELAPGAEQLQQQQQQQQQWACVEGHFLCVYAVHQSHISREARIAPASRPCDQTIYLTFALADLSWLQTARMLSALAEGAHERLAGVRVLAVRRFRLEPLEPSKVVVDGNTIGWTLADGPLEAEVVPGALRLRWRASERA